MTAVLKVVGTVAGIVALVPSPIQPIAAAVAVAANIGVGEGVDDLEPFEAKDFAHAIAGLTH